MKTDVRNVEPLWKGTKKVLCCVAVDGIGILPKAVGIPCGTTPLSRIRDLNFLHSVHSYQPKWSKKGGDSPVFHRKWSTVAISGAKGVISFERC